MAPVLLTKRIEFAAAHRYIKAEWDEAKNRAVFGPCYNPPAHGHNYMVEVTVLGEVDPKTGMVVNLFDLKRVLLNVLEEFDHKNLNLDMPLFRGSDSHVGKPCMRPLDQAGYAEIHRYAPRDSDI